MVLPKVVFRVANKGTQELMDIYDGLYGPSRKGQLNPFGKLQFSRVRQEIEKRLQIVEVTPDSRNIDLQSQMAGKFEKGKFKELHFIGIVGNQQIWRVNIVKFLSVSLVTQVQLLIVQYMIM